MLAVRVARVLARRPLAAGVPRWFSTSRAFKQQCRFILLASNGDVKAMQALVDSDGVTVNSSDFTGRTALHLAAAEGKLEAVKFLVDLGAEVNAFDSQNVSPLEEAIDGKHSAVVKFLYSNGAKIHPSRESEMISRLLTAAAQSDTDTIQRLVDAGFKVQTSDYDLRTPLHLAAAEGALASAKLILANGGDVTAIDRFGNTPLDDSLRATKGQFREVAQLLSTLGKSHGRMDAFMSEAFKHSLVEAMPMLCQRGGFVFGEAWIPTVDGAEFIHSDHFYADPKAPGDLTKFAAAVQGRMSANTPNSVLGKAFRSLKASCGDIKTDLSRSRLDALAESKLTHCTTVPTVRDGKCFGVFQFYSTEEVPLPTPEWLEHFTVFTGRLLSAAAGPEYNDPNMFDQKGPPGQACEVFKRVCEMGVFGPCLIFNEVDWFYSMGLQQYYFDTFSADILARHVHSFIAVKQLAQTVGSPEDIWLSIENNPAFGGGKEQSLMMIPEEPHKILAVERRMENLIRRMPADQAVTVEYFTSRTSHVPRGKKRMGMYILNAQDFSFPRTEGETNFDKLINVSFHRKPAHTRARYAEILRECAGFTTPFCRVFPPHPEDDSTPVMIAFPQTKDFHLVQLTQLVQQNKLHVLRKFVNTFNNGTVVYSFYFEKPAKEAVDNFIAQFKLCYLVPPSDLTPRFLNGTLSSDAYGYMSSVSRFVYYFINTREEDYEALLRSLKNDRLNLSRLKLLHSRMKGELVTSRRIIDVLLNYPEIMRKLHDNFEQTWKVNHGPVEPDPQLEKLIAAQTGLDKQVLSAIALFNSCVLKTNFYKGEKQALSFRLKPDALEKSGDWPAIPYGLFFVLGADFQGFHVRFRDISRGGIRLIMSRDRTHYNNNMQTQFAETYGLALTQNKKNKDIPEFGSKGTILLQPDSQSAQFKAFKSFVSSLLDLLVPSPEVVDRYGKNELLFLGPDEGTAHMMEWAALEAERRNYAYWRSFTTGKAPILGGVPHDTYGMTTRSVHRYVIGSLNKLGLKEEEVTKIQTGGPDGDLGSNEILCSKDKTVAIVDGSGVLYDPAGIDRTELTQLAHKRQMILHFNISKLGPGGFKVLVSDTNIKLPTGEMVDSGVKFRNEFHLHPLATADVFVPCGGRPEAVNLSNVNHLFANGKPKFKIVVEGANLFFTNDARMVLEDAGVTLFKDASTNKGGVTSSSKEVLAALALDDATFAANMSVKDPKNPPKFYMQYVKEIQETVEALADAEFECLWREKQRTGQHSHELTDKVSEKINRLNDFVQDSETLWANVPVRNAVLKKALPKSLVELVGLESIIARVPENYLKAIHAAFLASQYVYKHGLAANEFSFFEFMQPFYEDAGIGLDGGDTRDAVAE